MQIWKVLFSYGEFGDMYECRNKSVLDLLCVIITWNIFASWLFNRTLSLYV